MQKALLVTLILLATVLPASAEQFKFTGTTDDFSSPNDVATDAVIRELDSAKPEILVQAYSATSMNLAAIPVRK